MADIPEERVPPNIDLLHPEILSKEGIISIMEERHVDSRGLEDLEKNALVELYYKTVIPLPQRTYRLNRRGREMTKKQRIMAKRKRKHSDISGGSDTSSDKESNSTGLLTSFSGGGNRLKPPPSAINYEKKVIKLGGTPGKSPSESRLKSPPSTEGTQRKTISLNMSSSGQSPEAISPKSTGVIKFNPSFKTNSVKSSGDGKIDSQSSGDKSLIKLKRTSESESKYSEVTESQSAESKNSSEGETDNPEKVATSTDNTDDEEVVKKKFKRIAISWP